MQIIVTGDQSDMQCEAHDMASDIRRLKLCQGEGAPAARLQLNRWP